jgi:hypothetical protein
MTEHGDMEHFETRFADRVRAYTDPATERRIDALAMSRTAMSSQRATGWAQRRLGAGWAVAFVAVVLAGVVGVAIVGRMSSSMIGPQPTLSPAPSATGPVPEVLRHSWQRPYAVTPGLDEWGSGFLSLASDLVDFGPAATPAASRSASAIAAAGPDTLVATATAETQACAVGDVGIYRWSLQGKDTVMTLTAARADACAAREKALAGPWVRSDLPLPRDVEAPLEPGTYTTSAFDPFGESGLSGRLSYTVPEGWKVKEDQPGTFLLHRLPEASGSQPATDLFVSLFVQPLLAADFADGAICGPVDAAPGVGAAVDEIVAAIVVRPGVVTTQPTSVTIGGLDGQMLDVHLASSWTGGCQAPEGPVVGMPIVVQAGPGMGPVAGIGPDHPIRLILLDLGGDRTMAIVAYGIEPTTDAEFNEQVARAMPVIESFEFHRTTP